jgi:hypothetical protein
MPLVTATPCRRVALREDAYRGLSCASYIGPPEQGFPRNYLATSP